MFKSTITPSISDLNKGHHIKHSRITVWLEEGYDQIQKLFHGKSNEPSLIIANLNIDFLDELFSEKDVEIITGVKKIGVSSFILHQELRQGGKLCVRALTTIVHFDYSKRKSVPIPPQSLEILKKHILTES